MPLEFGAERSCAGARGGNRTRDLRITSALLYRLSYPGDGRRCYREVVPPARGHGRGNDQTNRWRARVELALRPSDEMVAWIAETA